MSKTTVYLLVLFSLTFLSYFAYRTITDNYIPLPIYGDEDHKVADFELIDQSGNVFKSRDYKDKIWVVNTFFTSCPTICPTIMKNMQSAHNVLRADEEVIMLSITVDPRHDNPERFQTYIERLNLDESKWKLLTGDKRKLYTLIRNSFLISATDGNGDESDFIHSENIVILDKNQKIRNFINGTDEEADEKILTSITKLKNT